MFYSKIKYGGLGFRYKNEFCEGVHYLVNNFSILRFCGRVLDVRDRGAVLGGGQDHAQEGDCQRVHWRSVQHGEKSLITAQSYNSQVNHENSPILRH